MKGAVSRVSGDRPLTSIQERKMKVAKNKVSPTKETPPHSAYNANRSQKYTSILDRFNPTKTLPARRLYPGPVN
jgi:hypothetical protein